MVNKFTNIKERVLQVAKKHSISQERFFKSIEMTSASFRGKAKETPLNSKAIVNIIMKYPEVDLYWLITGEKKRVDRVKESGLEYIIPEATCEEKDEIIIMLKSQIQDLKIDKEDLRELLKFARKK